MNNHVPLSVLFVALTAMVLPLSAALYLHGHANVGAVIKNALG
jgi:hypothetical protein